MWQNTLAQFINIDGSNKEYCWRTKIKLVAQKIGNNQSANKIYILHTIILSFSRRKINYSLSIFWFFPNFWTTYNAVLYLGYTNLSILWQNKKQGEK